MILYYYKSIAVAQTIKTKKFIKGCLVLCTNPTDTQINKLNLLTKVDKDFILDSLDPFEVPRYEVEDNIPYIFIRFPITTPDSEVLTVPAVICICPNCVVISSAQNIPDLNIFLGLNINTTQKTKFVLNFLLFIDSLYKKNIHSISKKIMNYSRNIENIDTKEIIRFVKFEYLLNLFLSSLLPTTLVLERLLQSKRLNYVEEEKDLVEDLLLSNNQLVEICKQNNRFIVNIRNAYTNILTNNLNKVIKVLTAFTLIFTIPTFIASFFGMNVPLPFEKDSNGFLIIFIFILVVTSITAYLFFKKKLM